MKKAYMSILPLLLAFTVQAMVCYFYGFIFGGGIYGINGVAGAAMITAMGAAIIVIKRETEFAEWIKSKLLDFILSSALVFGWPCAVYVIYEGPPSLPAIIVGLIAAIEATAILYYEEFLFRKKESEKHIDPDTGLYLNYEEKSDLNLDYKDLEFEFDFNSQIHDTLDTDIEGPLYNTIGDISYRYGNRTLPVYIKKIHVHPSDVDLEKQEIRMSRTTTVKLEIDKRNKARYFKMKNWQVKHLGIKCKVIIY